MSKTTGRDIVRVRGGNRATVSDTLVTEAPMEIRLRDTPLAVLMRTPGDDAELALGFAITEGIVLRPGEVADVRSVAGGEDDSRWELVLAPGVTVDSDQFKRNFYTSSSCGVCGKASIDAVLIAAPPAPQGPTITTEVLLDIPPTMRAKQAAFDETGGLHAAAAFNAKGELVTLREDIGRHNAVDKVIGAVARSGREMGELLLMVSGRVSFEIAQKAGVAGIPIVCGVSAASSLAVELAEELGMTVVGFLRDEGFNVYTGDDRIS